MRTVVCTIISKNYLAAARVLMEGVARHSPQADRVALLVDRVDGCFDPEGENFRVILSSELEIPDSSWFHFKYTILELNTAVKPFLIGRLMEEGYDAVVYLDPDIKVYSPLDEVWAALQSANAVVTPHLDQPVEDDKYPSEIDILRTGAYNLGFIALRRSKETLEFVRWWGRRMERFCVVDLNGGLFVDQKWMDLLPGMLETVLVLRHPGCNVAYWNIHGRRVEKTPDGYAVNGQPLRFFHFSGFHPRRPERFSKHQNRFELSDLPAGARALCAEYAEALIAAEFDKTSKWPYAYGSFGNGEPIVDTGRRIWWDLPELLREVSDPFGEEGGKSVRDAWNEILPDSLGAWSGITRLGWWLYQSRPEATRIMPDPWGGDKIRVLRWLIDCSRLEWRLPEEFIAPLRASLNVFLKNPDGQLPNDLRSELGGKSAPGMPSVAPAIYRARKDLQRIFRDPEGMDKAPYLLWLLTHGRLEHYLSPKSVTALKQQWRRTLGGLPTGKAILLRAKYSATRLVTLARASSRQLELWRAGRGMQLRTLGKRGRGPAGELLGVNLVGYARAEMGVGESVRAASRAVRAAGLEAALYGVEAHPKYRAADLSAGDLAPSLPFPVTVLHVNADQSAHVIAELGPRLVSTRYRIGVWAWELEEFPQKWLGEFEHLDEVWAPSDFCRTAIAAVSPKPVLRIPHAIEPLPAASVSREAIGIPKAEFTVLFVYDAMSVVARKNPRAVVAAFQKAFGPDDDVRLVLKVSHSDAAPETVKALQDGFGGARITLIDRVMDRGEVASLIQHADVMLSLHRSEGFGLTLAEAMSAGKTVICTGYSGNMDFTLPGAALPVRYSLVPVGEGNEPYDGSALWAEPDVEHAAAMLRQVWRDPAMRSRIGEEAKRRVMRDLSPEAVGKMMRRRLEAIHRRLQNEA